MATYISCQAVQSSYFKLRYKISMNTFLSGNIKSAKIILLTTIVIASFVLQFWVIASVAVYLIIYDVKICINASKMRFLKENLFERSTDKKQLIIKDSLQYLKSCRMIYFGYDYRNNTNIILQLQRDNTDNRELSRQECQIYEAIIKIYDQTVLILSKLQIILQISHKNLPQIKANINSFEDIFTANRQFQNIFVHQNYLFDFAEDIVTSVVKNDDLSEKIRELIEIVPQLRHRQQRIKCLKRLNDNIFNQEIKKEYEEYYNFFIDKNCSQNSQNVKKWINSLENEVKIKDSGQQFGKVQCFFDDDRSLATETETATVFSTQQPKQHNITIKKAQFLKKLDTLLMIGMIRRKQQEQEKKMINLDEKQSQID